MNPNDKITVLRGPERVRRRPAVIFGAMGAEGATNALMGVINIFVAEAALGHCRSISVTQNSDNSVTVKSLDRGFALSEELINGKPSWYYDFCELYFPKGEPNKDYFLELGKLHNELYGDDSEQYLNVEGDPFFDLTCAQYASEFMEVRVSDGCLLKQLRFEKGFCVNELTKQPFSGEKYTEIHFKPDPEVFGAFETDGEKLKERLKTAAATVKGLECEYSNQTFGEAVLYSYPNGICSLLEELTFGKECTPVYTAEISAKGRERYDQKEYNAKARVAVAFGNEAAGILCIHNHRTLKNGGRQLDSVLKAVTKYVNYALAKELLNGMFKKEQLDVKDVAKRLVLVIETECENYATRWENGRRESIDNKVLANMAHDAIGEPFMTFLKENLAAVCGVFKP